MAERKIYRQRVPGGKGRKVRLIMRTQKLMYGIREGKNKTGKKFGAEKKMGQLSSRSKP